MNKAFRLIASRRFAVLLLIWLSLASLAGVMLKGSQEFWQNRFIGKILFSNFVHIQDVFHSWWFITLLSLLGLSLLVCTSQRMRTPNRLPAFGSEPSWSVQGSRPRDWEERLVKTLGKPKFRESKGNKTRLFWIHHNFSHWGSIVFHFSMVLVLLGGAINGLAGFQSNVLLSQGNIQNYSLETMEGITKGVLANPGRFNGQVELAGFEPRFYDGVLADQYSAVLNFKDGDKTEPQTVEVNRTGRSKGLVWRLARYGFAPKVVISRNGKEIIRSYLNLSDIDHGTASRTIKRYVDVFQFSQDQGARVELYQDFDPDKGVSRSNDPRNPVLKIDLGQLAVTDSGAEVKTENSILLKPGETKEAGEWRIEFLDWRYWVLFELSYFPGGWLLNIGLVLSALGILIRFLFYRRVIMAEIETVGGDNKLNLWVNAGSLNNLFREEVGKKLYKGGILSAAT